MYSPSNRKRTKTTCVQWIGREDFPDLKPYGVVEDDPCPFLGLDSATTPISRFRRVGGSLG